MIRKPLIQTAARIVVALAAVAGLGLSTTAAESGAVTCDMSQAAVKATATQHEYSFTLDCGAGLTMGIAAVLDTVTGIAQEKATDGRYDVKWACTHDPWSDTTVRSGEAGVGGSSDENWTGPRCTFLEFNSLGYSRGPFLLGYTPPVPYTARVLDNEERNALAKLLANAALADLAVVSIAGPTTRQVGLSATYTVTVKNEGTAAAPVELGIVFAGKLDQTGQIVPGPGAGACELRRDAGINAAVYCTGGTLGAGETTTVVVQGRGQSAGTGLLIATLNPGQSVPESSYANNSKQLNVTVN